MNPLKTDIEGLSNRVGSMIAGSGISTETRMELKDLKEKLEELDTTKDIEAFKAGTQAGIDALHAQIADLKEQLARKDGPGSPAARFNYLMSELGVRFPEVSPFLSDPPEPKFLALIDKLLAK